MHVRTIRLPILLVLFAFGLSLTAGCLRPVSATRPAIDPAKAEIRLGSTGGFDAYLVHQSDVGVWTVKCLDVFERYGCPEIVALDDKGRCTILNSYSGKWTPSVAVWDGSWLGGIAHADVDPRRPGKELYVGGKRGNLYQIRPHPQGGFDANVIAYWPGREIHTLVAADLDGARAGIELIAFTRPGGVYLVEPDGGSDSLFTSRRLQDLPGRIRDAVVLEGDGGGLNGVVTVSRTGEASLLRIKEGLPMWQTIYKTDMGLGRIAVKPRRPGEPIVLYLTGDDGRIVRLEQAGADGFRFEIIYAGPQGPRGLAAGRFHDDPDVESVAVFGYSKKVELLTRKDRGWVVETIFEDLDKGHWLTTGEVDGRNSTDEIILSGYGARVVLLSRPPGYGLPARAAANP